VIEEILPEAVVVAEAFDDDLAGSELFGEEEQAVARAVDKRRREFTTARACARRALGGLGVPPVPILRGDKGAPRWPAGVVGSITHCDGYRAAAVARDTEVTTIGIDAEPHKVLPEGVLAQVAHPEEVTDLLGLGAAAPQVCWDALLFSAKESTYKAWFPLARRWLGFHDAIVTLGPEGGFTVRLLVPAPPPLGAGLRGRWLVRDGLLITALTVPGR
jgi:4'-phosphopantetheinyl transferase EntD